MRGRSVSVGWLVGGVLFLGIGFAAGQYVVQAPAIKDASTPEPVTYEVGMGTLGRSIDLPATLSWTVQAHVYAPRSGIVTQMVPSGPFAEGDVVLRLDERPMVVVPSAVPAFRDLALGDEGRDVQALNGFLARQGLKVDGTSSLFSAATSTAVRAWQERIHVTPSGRILLGDLLMMPADVLDGPTFLWADDVAVGAPVSGGAPLLDELTSVPELTVKLGASPPEGVAEGVAGVAILPDGRSIDVLLAKIITTDQGLMIAEMRGSSGSICRGVDCPEPASAGRDVAVSIRLTIVPDTTGPLVPSSAVQTDAAGRTFVGLPSGERVSVTVRVAAGGQAILSGVQPGTNIVIP